MNIILKMSALSLLALVLSCSSTKNTVEDTKLNDTTNEVSQEQMKAMDTKMESEGFSKGTVMYLKNSNCPYIIVDDKSGVKFDPINFDNKEYESLKNDNEKIYYKCRFLRMKNRCNDAQPVEIETIKKREG